MLLVQREYRPSGAGTVRIALARVDVIVVVDPEPFRRTDARHFRNTFAVADPGPVRVIRLVARGGREEQVFDRASATDGDLVAPPGGGRAVPSGSGVAVPFHFHVDRNTLDRT